MNLHNNLSISQIYHVYAFFQVKLNIMKFQQKISGADLYLTSSDLYLEVVVKSGNIVSQPSQPNKFANFHLIFFKFSDILCVWLIYTHAIFYRFHAITSIAVTFLTKCDL